MIYNFLFLFACLNFYICNLSNQRVGFFIIKLFLILLYIFSSFRLNYGGDLGSYINVINFVYYKIPNDINTLGSLYLGSFIVFKIIGFFTNNIIFVLAILNFIFFYNFYKYLFQFSLVKNFIDLKIIWLKIIIIFPIIYVITLLGFTRQAVSISFILISIEYLKKNNFKYFFLNFFLASLFHPISIFFSFLVLSFSNNKNYKKIILIIVSIFLFILLFNFERFHVMYINYIQMDYLKSQGWVYKVLPIIVSSLIIISYAVYQKKIKEFKIEVLLSIAMLTLSVFFILQGSTVIVDRMGYFLIPHLLLCVYNILIKYFNKKFINSSLIFFLFLQLNIFLYKSNMSLSWLP